MCSCMHFQEQAHVIGGAGKSEIHSFPRLETQAGDQAPALGQNFFFFQKTLVVLLLRSLTDCMMFTQQSSVLLKSPLILDDDYIYKIPASQNLV